MCERTSFTCSSILLRPRQQCLNLHDLSRLKEDTISRNGGYKFDTHTRIHAHTQTHNTNTQHTPVCHAASRQATCARIGLGSRVISTFAQHCHLRTAAPIERNVF